jgi:phage/plasmid-like protein (TIGR03299 family)
MSRETLTWLNQNTLIGMTEKRGNAWHYKASEQGGEPNHYPGFIPVDDVERRLFHWEAVSRPSFTTIPCSIEEATGVDDNGQPYKLVLIEGEQRMVRSDTGAVMGPAFKAGYQPHQYREWLLHNVATILDDDLGVTSAGLLKGGAVAWVEVSVPDSITTPQGVTFRPNLLAATSFDGSVATSYGRKVTDTVCDNTMAAALGEKGQKIKYKHTRYSNLKVGHARDALAMVHTLGEDYIQQIEYLDSIKVTPKQFSKFVDTHVLTDSTGKVRTWEELQEKGGRSLTMAQNKRDGLMRLYNHDMRVAPWAGSALGVVKAVNTFVHHEGIVRGAQRAERNMLSTVEGKFDTLDQETLDTLMGVLV